MLASGISPQTPLSRPKTYLLFPLILIFILIAGSACQGSPPKLNSPAQPSLTPLPPKTATVAALVAREAGGIRLMTYNIYLGGSFNSGENEKIDLLISIVKTYNPDILGIQEANGWDQDNFAIADKVAGELGMNYVYCKNEFVDEGAEDGHTFDTIILTKFPIIDSEEYPEIINCLGRAEVQLPDGQALQVFNIHVPYGKCQEFFPKMLKVSEPYLDGPAVLMGDFNVVDPDWVAAGKGYGSGMDGCPELMEESDWVWLKGNFIEGKIDQIWVSPQLGNYDHIPMYHRTEFLVHYSDIGAASDHRPVAADVLLP